MALTVEDGTGKANADSYISQTDADTYFSNHDSPTAWTGLTSDQKDAALRYATTALDGLFAWEGFVVTSTQALGWPRSGVWDEEGRKLASNAVPARIEQAVCELALLHTSEPLNSSYSRGSAIKRERVGPLETEYESGAPPESTLPIIKRIIRGLGKPRYTIMGSISRA